MKIKACPYCRSTAGSQSTAFASGFYIACHDVRTCGAQGPYRRSRESAADAWGKVSEAVTEAKAREQAKVPGVQDWHDVSAECDALKARVAELEKEGDCARLSLQAHQDSIRVWEEVAHGHRAQIEKLRGEAAGRRFTETRLFGQLVAYLAASYVGAALVLVWYLVTR